MVDFVCCLINLGAGWGGVGGTEVAVANLTCESKRGQREAVSTHKWNWLWPWPVCDSTQGQSIRWGDGWRFI